MIFGHKPTILECIHLSSLFLRHLVVEIIKKLHLKSVFDVTKKRGETDKSKIFTRWKKRFESFEISLLVQ